jgi:hypothetical protein
LRYGYARPGARRQWRWTQLDSSSLIRRWLSGAKQPGWRSTPGEDVRSRKQQPLAGFRGGDTCDATHDQN